MCNTTPVQPKVCSLHNVVMLLQDSKFHDITDMEFRGLLTYSMEHSPLEANWFSASRGIPHNMEHMVYYVFISAH